MKKNRKEEELLELWTKFDSNITENDKHLFRPSTDDAMRINFRFRVSVGISAWPCCIFVPNFVQICSFSTKITIFNTILNTILNMATVRYIGVVGVVGATHEGHFMVSNPCKN